MKKSTYIFLCITTFGIYSLYTKNKAKKSALNSNKELSFANDANINIDSFIKDLGNIENIENISYTISTLKISFKDCSKIKDFEYLKKQYKIKGCIKSNNQITFLFGDNSKIICEYIKNKIN